MLSNKNSASSVVSYKNSPGLGGVLAIVLISLLSAGILTALTFNMPQTKQQATLVLALENGKQTRMFQGEVVEGMTVFQALVASSMAGDIKLEYSFDSQNRVIINRLNGYSREDGKELVFYLNDSKINAGGISRIIIKGGDIVKIQAE